jgi:hypothetical protein
MGLESIGNTLVGYQAKQAGAQAMRVELPVDTRIASSVEGASI